MRTIKILFILQLMLFFSYGYSYDYSWPVEYEIENESLEEISKTIEDFIERNPEIQAYEYDFHSNNNHININQLQKKTSEYKLCSEREEIQPFGKILCFQVYLKDMNVIVNCYVPQIKGTLQNLIRLVSYSKDVDEINGRIVKKEWAKFIPFNDVEPTKQEIPIKESFEKNFISKLGLEYQYKRPAALDRWLSKLLSLVRKRKNFVDE